MSQAVKTINSSMPRTPELGWRGNPLLSYLPALLPLVGAFLLLALRKSGGPGSTPNDGTLAVLALLSYIFAAAALATNFWSPVRFLQKIGLWAGALGFFFNLSSWLVRWVAGGERENWIRMTDQITGQYHSWWFFSYIPFANLYDLSIAFSFGAAFATLLIGHRENTRFVGALSFPLIALILLLAIFIGNSFIDLPPVLDSYWRPIHVGVASMSYGVALVSFALAVMYLLKDGVKMEAMITAVALFVLAGFGVFSQSYDRLGFMKETTSFGALQYRLIPVVPHAQGVTNTGARVAAPYVGELLTLTLVLMLAVAVCFLLYLYKQNERARRWGHQLLGITIFTQLATIITLVYQIKNMKNVGALVGAEQAFTVGKTLLRGRAAGMPLEQIASVGANFLENNRAAMVLDVKGNPVELAGMIAALAVTFFVILLSYRTDKIRESLPSLEKLDSLTYKLVGVAFAGLAILLVTGAVWANESWGRYWGWDAKETGALVAWLSYGGYLHSRMAHGWVGRRSAYFAVVGFLLVLFTYLGVSYLLPGLHSYA